MATYKILYWQEIPSQIKAEDDATTSPCSCREASGAHRRAGGRARPDGADDYLAQWQWSDEEDREGSAQDVAEAVAASSRRRPTGSSPTCRYADDQRPRPRLPGARSSTAPSARRPRAHVLPEAGQVQGVHRRGHRRHERCRRRRGGAHLKAPSACRARRAIVGGRRRRSAATRCAAARCASSGTRSTCPRTPRRSTLDPAVTRDGDRILIDGEEIDAVDRPDPRHRDGPRHDDDRAAAVQSRNRRAGRRRLVREPAALRRLRRDVAHPLRHRASAASC